MAYLIFAFFSVFFITKSILLNWNSAYRLVSCRIHFPGSARIFA